MRLGKLLVYFDTSPALRLLRSPNAPFIIDVFDRCFKQAGRITLAQSELLAELIHYQEELHESHPEKLQGRADAYLTEWCSPDALWLRRSLQAGRDEPVYQLTPHTEDVFGFLDRVLDRDLGFVGTESRLKLVIESLADLVVGSSDDPTSRLAHLREEQQRLQEEITQIEASGRVTTYQPAQIRERFGTAVSLLRQLQGDFRSVEESFRNITEQVQQRQAQGGDTRGGILEFALDAEDVLKREDRQTGKTVSSYQDSSGQSGGEKAKLAFTILVAAIAYQYDLDPDQPARDRLHFVVVDEMFSKVDDQHAEYALELFRQFGLQLLIVAPLDAKARVTQPYVGCYLHVHKRENRSEVFAMTAQEFDERIERAGLHTA